MNTLPRNKIITGNSLEILKTFPARSVDLIFADPPYNLQLNRTLWRPDMSAVTAVSDKWDQFETFEEYDFFTRTWLTECKRVLKPSGTIWVIGTYHNIFRIGTVMQDLGFWTLNDILWVKTNPMPNFRGLRFANAHETLIWASKSRRAKYTFNHHALKALNGGKQMRSDWHLPVCKGPERLKIDGKRAHSTQKPESLLYRVILSSTHPGDLILDPFFGTGTTGAVAKRLHRDWIGIEAVPEYVHLAQSRIDSVIPNPVEDNIFDVRDKIRSLPRIPFGRIIELNLLKPGDKLYFKKDRSRFAVIRADGKLQYESFEGTIHTTCRHILDQTPCNGWQIWFYEDESGALQPIDMLRQQVRNQGTNE